MGMEWDDGMKLLLLFFLLLFQRIASPIHPILLDFFTCQFLSTATDDAILHANSRYKQQQQPILVRAFPIY
jgi:hypothetical protein